MTPCFSLPPLGVTSGISRILSNLGTWWVLWAYHLKVVWGHGTKGILRIFGVLRCVLLHSEATRLASVPGHKQS